MNYKSKIYVAGHNGLVGSAILRELKKKGFKKITSDEKIEFWATHIEDDTELLGYILDTELEIAGKGWENPNEEGYCIKHVVNWCKKARVNMYALVDNEVIETY